MLPSSQQETRMTRRLDAQRPTALAVLLIVASVIGLWAAFALTLDKFALLAHPDAALDCNFSVLVGCGKNLSSWQGSLFGFPNPLLGLVGWTATLVVGVAIFAGARFARWFWTLLTAGVAAALALVIFLITQSILVLHVLCPYCMITWSVTIPTFWAVSLLAAGSGVLPLPARSRAWAAAAYGWTPLLTVVSYAVVAIFAQVELDWIHRAFV
jgi:uncharacterized membrane protein